MRHTLRRLLWIVPTLFVVSLLAFWVLTPGVSEAPRFFQPRPGAVDRLVVDAMAQVAADGPDAPEAARTLVRLGGAGLPHVLTRLDTLEPLGRRRVAWALVPVAHRMGLTAADELPSPDAALLFWTRFWDDRGVDFRLVVVNRAVRRVGQGDSALRRAEVLAFDTFALPALIGQLDPDAKSPTDISRNRRLVALAASITERPWLLERDASPAANAKIVRRWRTWWIAHRAEFTTNEGPGRLAAMVRETQYGRWVLTVASSDGEAVAVQARAGLRSFGLLFASLAGAWLAAALASVVPLLLGRRRGWFFDVGCLALASVPVVGLVWLLGSRGDAALGALILTTSTALWWSRQARTDLYSGLARDVERHELSLGLSPWTIARRRLRVTSCSLAGMLPAAAPLVLTQLLVVEKALGLSGLGTRLSRALLDRDVSALMALVLLGAVTVALLQLAGDFLLWQLDPRARSGLARRQGAIE